MLPQVNENGTGGSDQEPLRVDAEGHPVFPEWSDSYSASGTTSIEEPTPPPEWVPTEPVDGTVQVPQNENAIAKEIAELDKASDSNLMAMADIEPIVSTTEAAEYFDRTSQWMYWGLKPDDQTGEHVFVWPDGTPIVPERIGDPVTGRRRFTMPILRAILQASYRRGNIESGELQTVIRRIRYTELGVEWRDREGWKYVDLGRNRHRWVRPEDAEYDRRAKVWKLKKEPEAPSVWMHETPPDPTPVVADGEIIDVEEVPLGEGTDQ